MVMRGCKIFQAQDNADKDITKAAVNSAQENSTTLIGEDTDLLVLLLYYAEVKSKPLYFKSYNQSRGIPKVIFSEVSSTYSYNFFTLLRDVIPHRVFMVLCVLHSCAFSFSLSGKNPTDIISLSSQEMAVIFGGKSTSSLEALHYQPLTNESSPNSIIRPCYGLGNESCELGLETLWRRTCTITVAIEEHVDFHAVMYVGHVKLCIVTIRCHMK
ncbi:hypothetical protein PR048_026755 [Dryococelus australis]|uniref:Uncharacterized protein n=1 Tax=Dryococelus australis TaxID=614101 RepID=A0ABQ9GM84_9NEOP|nr:hypothetical protein PR048_026755 [Dryococelus australis]